MSRIWKLAWFTRFIRKVFATKILLSGKFSFFLTLHVRNWQKVKVLLTYQKKFCRETQGRKRTQMCVQCQLYVIWSSGESECAHAHPQWSLHLFRLKETFGRAGTLKIHRVVQNKENMHTCVQCQKTFGRAGDLKRHMITQSGVKMYTCSECKKSFGQAGQLKLHMITHSKERAHACVQCQRSFGLVGNLKKHVLPTVEQRHIFAQNVKSDLVK